MRYHLVSKTFGTLSSEPVETYKIRGLSYIHEKGAIKNVINRFFRRNNVSWDWEKYGLPYEITDTGKIFLWNENNQSNYFTEKYQNDERNILFGSAKFGGAEGIYLHHNYNNLRSILSKDCPETLELFKEIENELDSKIELIGIGYKYNIDRQVKTVRGYIGGSQYYKGWNREPNKKVDNNGIIRAVNKIVKPDIIKLSEQINTDRLAYVNIDGINPDRVKIYEMGDK